MVNYKVLNNLSKISKDYDDFIVMRERIQSCIFSEVIQENDIVYIIIKEVIRIRPQTLVQIILSGFKYDIKNVQKGNL